MCSVILSAVRSSQRELWTESNDPVPLCATTGASRHSHDAVVVRTPQSASRECPHYRGPSTPLRMTGLKELRSLRLQLRQQRLDAVGLLHRGEAVVHIFGAELRLRLGDSFVLLDFVLHAIERCDLRPVADRCASVLSLADGACTTLLRDQHIRFALRLGELLFELSKRSLQVLDLRLLVG